MKNWNQVLKNWTPRHWYWSAAGAVVLVVLTLVCFPSTPDNPLAPHPVIHNAQEAWEAAQPHLNAADTETNQSVERHLQQVTDYYESLKEGGRLERFASEVLSLPAKWKLITKSRSDFDAYVSEQFASLVLSEDDVRTMMTSVIASYAHDLEATDNKMLVALKSDTDTTAADFQVTLPSVPQIDERFAEVLQAARIAAIQDVPLTIAREVANIVVMQVVGDVTAQALTSAGILGAGAASGVATFGVGLVGGLVFDWAFQKVTDPEGKLAANLRDKLTDLCGTTLESTRSYLEEVARQRAAVRRQVIAQALGVTP
jgi:hypothetical protein